MIREKASKIGEFERARARECRQIVLHALKSDTELQGMQSLGQECVVVCLKGRPSEQPCGQRTQAPVQICNPAAHNH